MWGSALGGEQTRWRLHAGVAPFELRRVPRHERGAGDVVQELEDRAPDHALLVGEALQLAAETARDALRPTSPSRPSIVGDAVNASMIWPPR